MTRDQYRRAARKYRINHSLGHLICYFRAWGCPMEVFKFVAGICPERLGDLELYIRRDRQHQRLARIGQ